jgi:hypothetical protein
MMFKYNLIMIVTFKVIFISRVIRNKFYVFNNQIFAQDEQRPIKEELQKQRRRIYAEHR